MDKIIQYINETYIIGYPRKDANRDLFYQESTSKYFAKMALEGMIHKDPVVYLEETLDDVGEFMTRGNGGKAEYVFSIGYDVLSDILGYIYGMAM